MKMKRGTDHFWTIRKYPGDSAWYAGCKCGYEYNCSKTEWITYPDGTTAFKTVLSFLYRYCPVCGARKKKYYDVVKVNKKPPCFR